VDCSHTFFLAVGPTNKIHDDLNLVFTEVTVLNLWRLLKTSSNASIELFTVCAVVLSCIKCLYDISSSAIWSQKGDNQCHIVFRIYCFIKNMDPVILCTLIAQQIQTFKSCSGSSWTAQYFLCCSICYFGCLCNCLKWSMAHQNKITLWVKKPIPDTILASQPWRQTAMYSLFCEAIILATVYQCELYLILTHIEEPEDLTASSGF
jgi:hypothetical protein